MISAVDMAGWAGIVLILIAYFLITMKKVEPSSRMYHALNLVGAVGVVINTYYYTAYPSVALNVVWMAIALYGLIRSIWG